MERISRINLVIRAFISYIIYNISCIIPRNKQKWVFGSHFGFRDNSKFLLFEVLENKQNIRAIWICNKKDDVEIVRKHMIECYYRLSPMGLYHCFTAGVFVCTQNTIEINSFASGGALYLNLNHGVGVKKCYWLRPDFIEKKYGKPIQKLEKSFLFKILNFPVYYRVPDMCLVTSKFQAETFFSPMFRIPLSNCFYANYPRNNLLLWNKNKVKALANKYEPASTLNTIEKLHRFRKIYIYMPTWRNDGSDFIKSAQIDFEKLENALAKRNDLLILKLHPYTIKYHPKTKKEIDNISVYSHIITIDSQSDVYYILPFTDCLITDYSSIYSDYSLMDKEIILFVFDLDDYLSKCTELENYDKFYPGVRAYDFSQLLKIIETDTDCHVSKEERDFIQMTYWGNLNEAKDIVTEVKNRLNKQ